MEGSGVVKGTSDQFWWRSRSPCCMIAQSEIWSLLNKLRRSTRSVDLLGRGRSLPPYCAIMH